MGESIFEYFSIRRFFGHCQHMTFNEVSQLSSIINFILRSNSNHFPTGLKLTSGSFRRVNDKYHHRKQKEKTKIRKTISHATYQRLSVGNSQVDQSMVNCLDRSQTNDNYEGEYKKKGKIGGILSYLYNGKRL